MNKSYLLSILDLYLLKEQDTSLVVEVFNLNNQVKIYFSYLNSPFNKTFVKVDKDVFMTSLNEFIPKIQGNLENVIETKNGLNYLYIFDNSRKLSFQSFQESDIKLIKSEIVNLKEEVKEQIVVETVFDVDEESYDTKLKVNRSKKLNFSMGFTTYITLFTTSVWFLDILLIALWIFKAFIK